MSDPLPTAVPLSARRRPSVIWLIPIAALVVSAVIAVQAWRERGAPVQIHFARGEGLRPGDDIRHRGVTIGRVDQLALTDDGNGVIVDATLVRQASAFARAGARFWVVRPHVGLSGVSGLETVIGPRYLAAEPGDGVLMHQHAGLDHAPAHAEPEPGSRNLLITASTVSGLSNGSPVTYRQLAVGRVNGIRLANDATAINIDLIIDPPYVDLVRSKTVFWNASGLDIAAGLFKGLKVEMESLQSLMAGGIAFATPDEPGEAVGNDHRFVLQDEAPEDARRWQPAIAIGAALLPPGHWAVWPQPVRLSCQRGRWRQRLHVQEGWGLPTASGWIIPADVVYVPLDAVDGTVRLIIGGIDVALPTNVPPDALLIQVLGNPSVNNQPLTLRSWTTPEDVLLYGDPASGPRPVSADQQDHEGVLTNDPGPQWHGALVRSRHDGAMVGILVRQNGKARIVSQYEAPVNEDE